MQTHTVKFGTWAVLLLLALTFGACSKDDTTEQETITTVLVHLTATDGSFNEEFTWSDPDGDGGNAPVIDDIVLPPNKTFNCHVHFYDLSKTPGVDITEEVEEEDTEHLLVYSVLVGLNLNIAAADTDANGKPFRLETTWTTGAASTGSVTVTLRHEPDKDAADPDVTGEVDAEVVFPVKIQ
ncbi:MAG: type 1 periplasmic binding fold superfamily protein [Saprospiraceae bacterium]|jgi:hypothetical protein|nr:type 1 periplasmic binding fold superfamily protein [Saprospiraceae bacterium]